MTHWPRALVIAAWAGAAVSGLLAVWLLGFTAAMALDPRPTIFLVLWFGAHMSGMLPVALLAQSLWSPDTFGLVIALLFSSAVLFVPHGWRNETRAAAYLQVAAALALLFGMLFLPIKTHAVKLDMPPPSQTE